jgi:Fic family protein
MTATYSPPLTLNPALFNRVAAIAEALGRWSARQDALPSPRLRRENRIHTIQASLAIEQNSLSVEQVTALFDGQRVLGPARDIQEVRNAITAYDALPRWDPSNPQHLMEAIHDALRSEIGSEKSSEMSSEKGSEVAAKLSAEIGATPRAAIDAVILGDLASAPTLSARRLAERLQLSPRAVENHLAALQRAGRPQRQGSPCAGHWQVL